ncbi:MAG: hypothetical protein JXR03_15850 [Cyclobacteriaceae bacterium]
MIKKILGYTFIAFALFSSVGIIGQLPKIIVALFQAVGLSSEMSSNYQRGYALGTFGSWLIVILLTAGLWVYGIKWIKTK